MVTDMADEHPLPIDTADSERIQDLWRLFLTLVPKRRRAEARALADVLHTLLSQESDDAREALAYERGRGDRAEAEARGYERGLAAGELAGHNAAMMEISRRVLDEHGIVLDITAVRERRFLH